MNDVDDQDLDPDERALLERLLDEDASGGTEDNGRSDPRIERIRELQQRLDLLGCTEREAAAPPSPAELGALEDRVQRLARERLGHRGAGSVPAVWRRPRWPLGLAAVLAIGLGLWAVLDTSDRPPEVAPGESFRLNGAGTGELGWRPTTAGSVELRWNAAAAAGARYEVRAYAEDPAVGGVELAASEWLDDPCWDPVDDHSATETPVSAWPETVWIEIREETFSGVRTVVSEPLVR